MPEPAVDSGGVPPGRILSIRIVYASTRQIYGKAVQTLPAARGAPHQSLPTSTASTKPAGRCTTRSTRTFTDLRTTSLRLTNTYGPRQLMKHNRQGFAGWFIRTRRARRGDLALRRRRAETRLQLRRRRRRRRFFWYRRIDRPRRKGRSSIWAPSRPRRCATFVERSCTTFSGKPPNYRIVPFPEERRRIDIGDFYTDYSKIERERWGGHPKTSLRDGLAADPRDYYQEHIEHYV